MVQTNNTLMQSVKPAAFAKSALIGWGIALVVILLFILPVKHPRPEWGQLWMIRPLIITPIAGAVGGACFYFLDLLRQHYRWNLFVTAALSTLIYIIGLWMGIVLGLVGTLWN